MTRRHHIFAWATTASLLILLLSQLFGNFAGLPVSVAFAATKPQAAPGYLTFQQFLQLSNKTTNHSHFVLPSSGVPVPESPAEQHQTVKMLPAAEPPTMQPIKQLLSAAFFTGAPNTPPLDLVSSDHRLEVKLAAGSLDLSHATVAGKKGNGSSTGTSPSTALSGPVASPTPTTTPPVTPTAMATPPRAPPSLHGPFTLVVTEQHGAFAGDWNMLGAYQLQIVDASGKPLSGIVLRHPLTIIYHYQRQQLTALDLDPGKLFLNWYDPGAKGKRAVQDIIPMQNNAAAQTLTAVSRVLGPGPFDAGNGDPQNQSAPHAPVASVEGNSGQLAYSYPLQVTPAPDGFVPQLALSYSTGTTNAVHSLNSPASDVGEGWSLSLGSITAESYPSSSAGGAATWYFISGVDNVSDRLIQDTTISGGTFFQTEHISHLRIQEVNPTSKTPCFNVWDESGTYYQFGCTQDSLQYRKDSDGTLHLYEWDLDEIIAPNEGSGSTLKEIVVTYLQECGSQSGNCPSATSSSTTSIRDSGIEQIEYGTVPPGQSLNNGGTLDGTVDFSYLAPETVTINGVTWATSYSSDSNYQCSNPPKSTTLRCDDPLDYTGGNPAPTVMSTLTLQKVVSYVSSDQIQGDAAYKYDFTYQDTPFSSKNPATNNGPCADPTTNPPVLEYCAGEHLLTQITPIVYQGELNNHIIISVPHTLKPVLFHYYAWFTNTYSDQSDPLPGGVAYTIAIDRELMDAYLDTNTGEGAHIDYERAYNNTHGTPTDPNTGDERHDPLYCWVHPLGSQYDCSGVYSHPDDHAWTEQVVTQITSIGEDSSALSPATTTYAYLMANTSGGNNCNGQCVGDNWLPSAGSNDDQDWADFYHGEFKGFNAVSTVSPSNDLTVDSYYSTKGWFSPESDASNYNSGQMYEQQIYSGPKVVDANLLQQTQWHYTGENDDNSCDGNLGPPYVPCLAMAESSTTTDYEGTGSGNGNAPSLTTSYQYDDFTSSKGLAVDLYHNLDQETITSSNAPTVTKVWSYAPDDSGYPGSGWIEYDVNKVAHSEIDDSSGRKWDCQSYTYDEFPSGTSPSLPEAGLVTTTNSYSSSACTPPTFGTPMITTYTGYDAYGNPVATVDGVAAANYQFYGIGGKNGENGCTLSTAPANMSPTWAKTLNESNYTTCTAYDSYNAQPTQETNAFGQFIQTEYDYSQGGLPIQETDVNGQNTTFTYTYDANSGSNGTRYDTTSQPGETGSFTTESYSSSSCMTSGLSGSTNLTPCYEEDSLSGFYANSLTQTFYDAQGREVETSTPTAVPSGGNSSDYYYTVQLTEYDDVAHTAWKSVPFIYVSTSNAGAGWLDPKASSTVDYEGNPPTGTMTYDDAMNRTIAVDDPLFGQTVKGVTYTGINCPSLGANATSCIVYELDQVDGGQGSDTNYYATTKSIDANNHVTETFADMLGNTRYVQVDSGDNGNTLTPAKITATQYNVLNEATSVTVTDEQPQSGETTQSVTTTMSYDDLGRLTTLVDPDRGTHNYSYDNDGHLTEDSSGSRTLGYNYDLLGRLGCEETAAPTANATGNCSAGTPLIQNTYDQSAPNVTWQNKDYPVGQITQSVSTTIYPDGTQSTSTESMQYDQRGRVQTQQLALSLPTGWNISTPLPVYQLSQDYNDANQPTSTQTFTIANGQSTPGYTFTDVYDGTSGNNTGALVGLSNNLGAASNVASLLLNENALPGKLKYYTSAGSGSIDASEQFAYDGDLRPQTDTATWGSGSGQSGQIFSESRWYDFAGNVVSLATTQASVPGQSGSGGSETENYCYNEQDELVWASNMTAPSPTSTETCGSQTPGNSLNGASYTTSYVYTNLGQLWQGPVAGGPTNYQYMYCNTAPHQLSGLYALGSTCTNKSGAVYKDSSYDAWGNVTGRTYGTTSETLAYDELDRLVKASLGGPNDYFAYDASGNRTVQRATSSSTTTLTVYAFGLEEYQYSGTGTLQNQTYYYNLGNRLIGALTGLSSPVTVFYLTNALGNLMATFNNTQGAAAIQGNQVYGPYGNSLYSSGSMDTAKGYTGQYADALTGLDYYVSRYYDSVAGIFLSADTKEGNPQGMNPYAYVDENPETMNDPTGHDGQENPATVVMLWYMGIEGTSGILIDKPPPGYLHNPAVEIQNAWVPDWDSSADGLVTTMVTMEVLSVSGGNPRGSGYADIMNTNLHLIYEVKGGQTLPGGGTSFPSTYTIAFGWAQARWYAAMANQDPRWNQGTPWTAGNNSVDTRLNAVCPLACMTYMDNGTPILIMNTGYGVLAYWVLPTKNFKPPAASYWAQWFREYSPLLGGITAATVVAIAGGYSPGGSGTGSNSGSSGLAGLGGGTCSFSANTVVWTPKGEVPIGQLQVDEQVLAYNPLTRAMQEQPILQVFEHTDADLVNVMILPTVQSSVLSSGTAEIIQTTRSHPFLTVEEGFIPVSQLKVGMHIMQANGSVGIVTAIRPVVGSMVMYNLDVAQDHTFIVGEDQWIVHNKCFDGVA